MLHKTQAYQNSNLFSCPCVTVWDSSGTATRRDGRRQWPLTAAAVLSSSPVGGGAIEEGGAKTTIGGGGEGEWAQKWGRNDDNDEYDAYDVGRSIRSNACIVAGGLIHLWGASWDCAMYRNTSPDTSNVNIIYKIRLVVVKSPRRPLHESTSARWYSGLHFAITSTFP